MRSLRFIFIALITFLFVTNADFLVRTVSYGKADAAAPPSSAFVTSKDFSVAQKDEQKIADCIFGVCVDRPKIPISIPGVPSGDRKEPIPPANPQSNVSLAGKWQSDWGQVEFNSDLTGHWNQGSGIGQIKDGTYDPQTRKLVFHYYQPWNDMNGTATFTLSEDGNRLSGTWTQQRGSNPPGSGGSGGWTMTRDTTASAPTPSIDLTGTWVESGSLVTIDERGCTAGYSGNVSIDGQDSQHRVFTLRQNGNQLIFPVPTLSTTWGSGSNSGQATQSYQGTVSGNRVTYIISGSLGFTAQYTGTISNDGNTVTGEGICKGSRGSATANVNFTWTRKIEKGQYKFTIYVSGADNYPGTNIAEPGGHAWISLSDGQTTNYYSFAPQKLWQAPYSVIGVAGSLRDAKEYKYDIFKEYTITQEGFKKARQAIVDWNDIYNLESHNCATFATTIGIASGALSSQDVSIFARINPASLGNYLREHGGKSH